MVSGRGGHRGEPRASPAHAAYIAWGSRGRVYAHRVCAHNLWLVCERHRALLAEIHDGLLDRAAILQRRDELAAETHNAYGQTFPLDQPAFESLRQSIEAVGQGHGDDAHLDAPSPLELLAPGRTRDERLRLPLSG